MKTGPRKSDWSLRFFHDVLQLEALHFGYWKGIEPVSVATLRLAQRQYTDHLLDQIPPGVRSVLDVGAGTGVVSAELLRRAYAPEAVAPDDYQRELFTARCPDVPFHLARFEDLALARRFDLILMAESCQYLQLDRAFENCRRLLRDDGYLLLADYFRRERTRYYRTTHVWPEWTAQAQSRGFVILTDEDITEHVLPTLALGQELYTRYALPFLEVVTGYFADRHAAAARVVRVICSRWLRKIRHYLYDHNREKLDPERFRAQMYYRMVLLQKK